MSPVIADDLVEPIVRAALAEDLGRAGDVTVAACIDPAARMSARFVSRQEGVVAGVSCARLAIAALDPAARFEVNIADGGEVMPGSVVATVEGLAGPILSAERTALNLLGRLSGVATLTAAYVRAVKGTRARITDTRKTTPGLRALEKFAVRCGGGVNHRFGLDDAVLIKDNHIAAAGGVSEALRKARAHVGHMMKVEIEVDNLAQFDVALPLGPDVIMLDNFSLADMAEAVRRNAGRVVLEASGGVNLNSVGAIAHTGVDVISIGALTHSAPVLDLGLDAA